MFSYLNICTIHTFTLTVFYMFKVVSTFSFHTKLNLKVWHGYWSLPTYLSIKADARFTQPRRNVKEATNFYLFILLYFIRCSQLLDMWKPIKYLEQKYNIKLQASMRISMYYSITRYCKKPTLFHFKEKLFFTCVE